MAPLYLPGTEGAAGKAAVVLGQPWDFPHPGPLHRSGICFSIWVRSSEMLKCWRGRRTAACQELAPGATVPSSQSTLSHGSEEHHQGQVSAAGRHSALLGLTHFSCLLLLHKLQSIW